MSVDDTALAVRAKKFLFKRGISVPNIDDDATGFEFVNRGVAMVDVANRVVRTCAGIIRI